MAHYVIVGGGRVGTRLAAALDAAGHGVALVDRDPRTVEGLAPGFSGELVAGVGFDRSALLAAGIDRAQGLAAVTADDNTNIIAARVARETFHVDHVVARIYDADRARLYQRLGIPRSPRSSGRPTRCCTGCCRPAPPTRSTATPPAGCS